MDAASLIATIDAEAPAGLERHGVPGLSVGVLSRGERAVRTFGVASLATGEPVRPETTFRIASITKPHVAALVLGLVEERRIALDEPLAGLRLPWPAITLRHLLSHQAGLAGDWPRQLSEYGDDDDALQRLVEDEVPAGPVGPGEHFAYCNAGYWLAGALVERATDRTFEEAMRVRVLEPLGMGRTGFAPGPSSAEGHDADPGSREHRVAEPLPYPRARRPSGGLFSCVDDLLSFAAHQLGGPGPLGAESIQEMQTAQVEADPEADYGLGLFSWRGRERPVLEHGGSVPGFASGLILVPEEDTAVVVLTNSGRGHLVREDVLAAIGLGRRLPPEIELPFELLEGLAGTYREPLGADVVVSAGAGGLDIAWGQVDQFTGERVEHPASHLRPVAPDWFMVRDGEERGDSAEFLRGGEVLRYGWLFERSAV